MKYQDRVYDIPEIGSLYRNMYPYSKTHELYECVGIDRKSIVGYMMKNVETGVTSNYSMWCWRFEEKEDAKHV